jgi:hypothetical protein
MKAICPEFNCLTQRVHSSPFPFFFRLFNGNSSEVPGSRTPNAEPDTIPSERNSP